MASTTSLSLHQTGSSPTYAPFHVALSQGLFAQEGLDIDLRPVPPPGEAAKRVVAGDVDVCLGGIMRVLKEYDLDPRNRLVGFGEIVARDPVFLVARQEHRRFTLADLKALRLRRFTETPTAWLCLQRDLSRAGIDPATLEVRDGSVDQNLQALFDGSADIVALPEPHVERAVERGAHVAYALGERGPEAHSCFYARPDTIADRRGELVALVRAIGRALGWMASAAPEEIAALLAERFPEQGERLLAKSFHRYKRLGLWPRQPLITRDGFEVIQASLLGGGFIASLYPFEQAVDNSIAGDAMLSPQGSRKRVGLA
jgi:NitT/TauT family transport system substrate-binding protein